ncbi:MAG TPA: 50S ribosomal protein L15 [Gammaproteobacteria bacterium]|nr:50S ribosomal protein L15 [Gammaproteobacteria bacterium]
MRLNEIRPAPGSHKQPIRVGRGIAAGRGKTAGRGTKGQHARTGGLRKVGFEGGQMPLQRRLPRSGFASHMSETRLELRLGALGGFEGERVDLAGLKAAGLVPAHIERVKIILNGAIERALIIADPQVVATRGARAAIEAAGGRIED